MELEAKVPVVIIRMVLSARKNNTFRKCGKSRDE